MPDEPMTEAELKQLRQNLARLSEDGVKRLYQTAWEESRMKGDRLSPAKSVQQLVAAWKMLWRWRRSS